MPLTTETVCLSPCGPLTATTIAPLATHARDAIAAGAASLVVDLGEVTNLDRRALDVLLNIAGEARRSGGSLALASPNGLCADILRITQVDQAIPILPDLARAG